MQQHVNLGMQLGKKYMGMGFIDNAPYNSREVGL